MINEGLWMSNPPITLLEQTPSAKYHLTLQQIWLVEYEFTHIIDLDSNSPEESTLHNHSYLYY